MDTKTDSSLRKLFSILGAWVLLLSVIQGLALYYFVTRDTARKDTAQAKLINKKTDKLAADMETFPRIDEIKALNQYIEKIEKDVIKLDGKFEEILKKMKAEEAGGKKEEVKLEALKEFTPDLRIKSQKPFFTSGDQAKCIYAIQNKGKHSVKLNNIKLYLSTNKIYIDDKMKLTDAELSSKIRNQLKLNNDFAFRTTMNMVDIAPGEEIKHSITIELLSPKKISETIYYCVTFDAQTDPNVIKPLTDVDKDKLVNKKFFYILGDIVTPG